MTLILVGADEAGYGPYAGSMYAVAAACLASAQPFLCCMDSKKFSPDLRKMLQSLSADRLYILASHTAEATPRMFDVLGYAAARRRAFVSCVGAVLQQLRAVERYRDFDISVIIDGNTTFGISSEGKVEVRCEAKADANYKIVGYASCVAKWAQVKAMGAQDKITPEYRFRAHKGYGVKAHEAAIEKYGALEGFHRIAMLRELWLSKYKKPLPIARNQKGETKGESK